MHEQRLVVVGQGYVGLPLAMRAVDAGFIVVGCALARGSFGLHGGEAPPAESVLTGAAAIAPASPECL